jgi:hypothetical protein
LEQDDNDEGKRNQKDSSSNVHKTGKLKNPVMRCTGGGNASPNGIPSMKQAERNVAPDYNPGTEKIRDRARFAFHH